MAAYWEEYTGTSITGAAQALANMDRQRREIASTVELDRMRWEMRGIRSELDYFRKLGDAPEAPEPSVEVIDHTPAWWSRLKEDPIWEIFKRPKLN